MGDLLNVLLLSCLELLYWLGQIDPVDLLLHK